MAILIQHGQVTAMGATSTVAIDPVGSLSSAFVVVQSAGFLSGNTGPEDWAIRGWLSDVDQLSFSKYSGATLGAVSWFVVEATEGEFRVEALMGTVPSGGTVISRSLSQPFALERSFLVGSTAVNAAAGKSKGELAFATWRFIDGTTIEVERGASDPAIRTIYDVCAVEWAEDLGVTVTHLLQDLSGDLSSPVLVPHGVVDLDRSRTLAFASMRHALPGLEQCAVAVHLPDNANVSFQREADATSYPGTASVFLVQFPEARGVDVIHATQAVNTNNADELVSPGGLWDPGASLAFVTASCGGTGAAYPRDRYRIEITGGTQVTARRGYVGQPGTLGLWIADFGGWQLPVGPASPLPEAPDPPGGAILGALDLPPGPPRLSSSGSGSGGPGPQGSSGAPLSPRQALAELYRSGGKLAVELNGTLYSGWTQARILRSIEAASSSFDLEVTDRGDWPIPRGSQIVLRFGELVVANGYLDGVDVSVTADSHRVRLQGRDATADLVDCAAGPQDEWFLADLGEIVADLAAEYDLDLSVSTDLGPPFEYFARQPGESAWDAIDRACRQRGVLATAGIDRDVLLFAPGAQRVDVALVWGQGGNVLEVQSRSSDADRFAEYVVRGSQPGSDVWEDPSIAAGTEGRAFDVGARAGRRLEIISDGFVDDEDAQRKAEKEAAVRAARSVTVTVVLQGWRHRPGGPLWKPGYLVQVDLPPVRMSGDLLIKAVALTYGEAEGYRVALELVRPDAYQLTSEVTAELDPDVLMKAQAAAQALTAVKLAEQAFEGGGQ